MIKAVIFDLDNTLANRYRAVYDCFQVLIESHSDVKPQTVEMECILQDLCVWEEAGAANKGDIVRRLKKKYGIDIEEQHFRDYWNENLYKYEYCFNETESVLKYCREKYLVGCVTNGGSFSQRSKLRNCGIEEYFDAITVSAEGQYSKPDKRIFVEMADRLKVKPEECVFVGDSFSLDMPGAVEAGCDFIWINSNPYMKCKNYPVKQITCIEEIRKYL